VSPPPVAVVGGGISGLAAALALIEGDAEVVLLEAGPRFGGKVATRTVGSVVVEEGADSFLDREPHGRALCEAVGLGDELVAPAVFGAVIWSRGRLRPLPPGFSFGLPLSPWAAWRHGPLTARGAARAAADLVLPGPLRGPDVSVASWVRRRFGVATLENLVDPLLAGTRAGSVDELSLAAALPTVDELARRHRSVILGLRRARHGGGAPDTGPPPFLAPRGGMTRLVDHLVRDLEGRGAHLRTGARVTELQEDRDGFRLRTADGDDFPASGAVLALPAYDASSVLGALSPAAAAGLATIPHATVAVVTLAYAPDAFVPPENSSGMLVPRREQRTLAACSWTSLKWPGSAPPSGEIVVRAFVGRTGRHPALRLTDHDLAERVAIDLDAALAPSSAPRLVAVSRWNRGLPQYHVGHLDRLDQVEATLTRWPRIALAGASFRGSGLPDCIRQGHAAALRVLGLEPD
jgi:oxygen-dependent protoporphyrinogen oxidase